MSELLARFRVNITGGCSDATSVSVAGYLAGVSILSRHSSTTSRRKESGGGREWRGEENTKSLLHRLPVVLPPRRELETGRETGTGQQIEIDNTT